MALRYLGPWDPGTMGPWDPWSFGLLNFRTLGPIPSSTLPSYFLFRPPTLLWFGMVWYGGGGWWWHCNYSFKLQSMLVLVLGNLSSFSLSVPDVKAIYNQKGTELWKASIQRQVTLDSLDAWKLLNVKLKYTHIRTAVPMQKISHVAPWSGHPL